MKSLAQDQSPGLHHDTVSLPCYGLAMLLKDTVLPTLGNSGKGLLHYDCIFPKNHENIHLFKYCRTKQSMMIFEAFTETDLEILRYNLLFLDKQNRIQVKEWIRKEKWKDLNLGQFLEDFYMKPVIE